MGNSDLNLKSSPCNPDKLPGWGSCMAWGDIPDWSYDSVKSLMEALKAVEPSTYSHCLRVGEYSRRLAAAMGMNEFEQKVAEFAGILHDIGKIGIERNILLKPGKLDAHELDVMQSHSIISEQIIQPFATHPFFKQILPAVRGHHERIDGEGYPDKLMGDEIPLIARVILIVDTYDAMSMDRVYRKGLNDEIIYAELKRCSGTQFEPELVRIFLAVHASWNKQKDDVETFHRILRKVA